MDDALITTARAYEEGLKDARKHGFYCGVLVTVAATYLHKRYQEQKRIAREM